MKFYISDVLRMLSAIIIWLLIMEFLKNSIFGLVALGVYYLAVYLLLMFYPVVIGVALFRRRKKHEIQR